VESIQKRGNEYIGRSRIIDSPAGRTLQSILDATNNRIGISTKGCGSVVKKGGVEYVNEDYQIFSFDATADPSAPNAFAKSITESIKQRKLLLTEGTLDFLQEMFPKGNSLKDLPTLSKQDAGAFGFSNSFNASPQTHYERSQVDTSEILEKLALLNSKQNFDAQDFQDASNMRSAIATVQDPFLRQKLLNRLRDTISDQIIKQRSVDFISRMSKFNRS
jgi:hypothetical protein